MISIVVFGAFAVYLIIYGIRIFITGTLSQREEDKLAIYTEESVRPYKIAYAISNIVGGLILAAISVVRYLGEQKIIEFSIAWYLILIVPVAAGVAAILLTKKKFKEK